MANQLCREVEENSKKEKKTVIQTRLQRKLVSQKESFAVDLTVISFQKIPVGFLCSFLLPSGRSYVIAEYVPDIAFMLFFILTTIWHELNHYTLLAFLLAGASYSQKQFLHFEW